MSKRAARPGPARARARAWHGPNRHGTTRPTGLPGPGLHSPTCLARGPGTALRAVFRVGPARKAQAQLWFGPARSPVKSLGRKISSRPLPDIFISRCHQTYLSHADSIIFLGTARAVLRAPAPTTLLPPCSARHLLLSLVPGDLPWPAARPCSTPSLTGRVPLSSSSLLATRTGWRSRAGRRRSYGRRCRRTRRTSSCGSSSTPR